MDGAEHFAVEFVHVHEQLGIVLDKEDFVVVVGKEFCFTQINGCQAEGVLPLDLVAKNLLKIGQELFELAAVLHLGDDCAVVDSGKILGGRLVEAAHRLAEIDAARRGVLEDGFQ